MDYCKISLKKVPKNAKYSDYTDTAFISLFDSTKVKPKLAFSRSEFKQDSVKYTKGMSISGVQQKLSLKINNQNELVPVTEKGEYILKPSPEEFPNAAENEHTAMITSQLLDIPTATCGLVSFSEGELAYITKRFDRLKNGEKQHQEDLVQGFEMKSDNKYDKSYEEAGKLIAEMTNGKQSVVLDFIFRVIHAYLIGNNDMHLKNISLQKRADNSSKFYDKLAPNYDCLYTEEFENVDNDGFLALDLLSGDFSDHYLHYGFYTGHDFIELGNRLNIREISIKKFIRKIKSKEESLISTIKDSYMPEAMREKAIGIISDRMRVLLIGVA